MTKPRSEINFWLTDEQMKEVEFSFEKAYVENSASGGIHRGSVFCQIHHSGHVTGGYIPHKYSLRIKEILEEMAGC